MFKNIILVAWHGKNSNGSDDNGASKDWLVERELTVAITKQLFELCSDLEQPTSMFWVNEKLSLNEKIDKINLDNRISGNTTEDTILLSIHINSGGGEWLESFSYKRWPKGLELWQVVLNNIATQTGQPIRWAKYENESQYDTLWIVHDTIWCTSLLIECWFIDSENDRDILIHDIDKIAIWLFNWLAELCDFKKLEETDLEWQLEYIASLKQENKTLTYENIELKERLSQIEELAKLD